MCALFALGAQTIFLSNFCKWDRCSNDNNNDFEDNFCFLSRCSVGQGASCSIIATIFWITAGIITKLVPSSSSFNTDREEGLMRVEKNESDKDDL